MPKKPASNTAKPQQSAPPAPEQTQEHAGAGETQAAPAKKGSTEIVAYLVVSQVEGFRRAGRSWPRVQTRIEVAELSDDDIDALFAEPMLSIVGVSE